MPRSLVSFALVLLAVLFPVNAGAVQGAGAAGVTWWVIGAVTFALPSTVVILALARRDGTPFASMQRGGHLSHGGALGIWVAGTLAVLSASIAAVTFAERALQVDLSVPAEGALVVALSAVATVAGRWRAWGPVLVIGAVALGLVVLIGLMTLSISTAPVTGSTAAREDWLDLGGWSWLGLVVLGLVGAHSPFQRAALRPVGARPVWWAMGAVIVGYLALTLAFAGTVPETTAVGFTSLADLGATLGTAWGTVTSALVALSFAATAVGLGAVFHELGGDLRLPRMSATGLVVLCGTVCFLLIPVVAAGDDSGSAASERVYAVLQGAAAMLWALGYAAFGLLAIRRGMPPWTRVCAGFTIALAVVGVVGVMTGPFTGLVGEPAWAAWVVVVAAVAIAVAWVAKAEQNHHA